MKTFKLGTLSNTTATDTFKAQANSTCHITDKKQTLSDADELLQIMEQEEYALLHSENDEVKVAK